MLVDFASVLGAVRPDWKLTGMPFRILDHITDVEIIARGTAIQDRQRLNRLYGDGPWRKLKGRSRVRLQSGSVRQAEIHWYEAHGIGPREYKIKRLLS